MALAQVQGIMPIDGRQAYLETRRLELSIIANASLLGLLQKHQIGEVDNW